MLTLPQKQLLLGYTELLNLYNIYKDRDFKIIGVHYSLHNKVFFGYWKMKKNSDMKKELVLLDKMKKIDNNIELSISFSDP